MKAVLVAPHHDDYNRDISISFLHAIILEYLAFQPTYCPHQDELSGCFMKGN